ncbi:MAG TPA: NnrU family protein [Ramlibacter sp.]|uniref:NnrU family protein n=1 Tax=Ramlibacter sp. TaxID=1917967 RepID=UPI002B9A82A3|nr:NnrU family protein [Ramlibacter sp.]HVZ46920.1 NnrU family protein [Ramlibacter sp.]
MTYLIAGLVIFLGVHSVRLFAEPWREATIARMGPLPWKGLYSLVSIAGFALLVWGYGQSRGQVPLWDPPHALHYVTALLMLPVFPLFIAAYVPRNGLKAALHHPQVLSVKTWAFAHLLSNGSLADVLLFGGFLLWGVLSFRAARKRDREQGKVYPPGTTRSTAITVVVGLAIYVVFAGWLHGLLIGVQPV